MGTGTATTKLDLPVSQSLNVPLSTSTNLPLDRYQIQASATNINHEPRYQLFALGSSAKQL